MPGTPVRREATHARSETQWRAAACVWSRCEGRLAEAGHAWPVLALGCGDRTPSQPRGVGCPLQPDPQSGQGRAPSAVLTPAAAHFCCHLDA